MPKTDSDLLDDPSAQEDAQANSTTRIDRAHVATNNVATNNVATNNVATNNVAASAGIESAEVGGAFGASDTPREARAEGDSELAAEQLRGQADQLAAYLRSRQRDLDQRESRLNARMAQLDASARNARMTLNQQQAELSRRESALIEQEKEAESRLARLASAEAHAVRLRDQLHKSRDRYEEQQKEMDTERTTLAAVGDEQARKEEALRHERQQIDRHRKDSLQVILDRQKAQEAAQSHDEQAAARHRQAAVDLDKKRDALGQRSEQVDRSRLALLKLRSELGQMHRETLDIRMAAEELWSRMSGAAPPIALSRSLERIRARQADQYKMVATELAEQKRELQAIRTELIRQHEQLVERKQELEGWAKRREEEIQRQTARLAAREEELGSRQTSMDDLARQWHAEQLDYQEEIRQLRVRLDESSCTAVTA